MPNPLTISCGVAAHAIVRVEASRLEECRKSPAGARGTVLSAGFLKHTDAQTMVVLAAFDQAIRDAGLLGLQQADGFAGWGVIAAPRFLGRAALTPAISRYHTEGAWGVSPHLVPHRSLHSISGTVSQVHAIRGPNFGVGGGPGCEVEGLIAAASTLDGMRLPGLWLLLSRVEPDLPPVDGCRIAPGSTVEAVALALTPPEQGGLARLDLTLGLPASRGAPDFDLGTLAALLERVGRQAEASAALGPIGRVTLRSAPNPLPGPHAIERFPTVPSALAQTERRLQP